MTELLSNYKLRCSQKNKYLSISVVPRTLLCFNYKSGQCGKESEHSLNRPNVSVLLQRLCWFCTGFAKTSCECNQNILEVASPPGDPAIHKKLNARLSGTTREKDMKGTNMQNPIACYLSWRAASGPCSQEESAGRGDAAGSSVCLEEALRGSWVP